MANLSVTYGSQNIINLTGGSGTKTMTTAAKVMTANTVINYDLTGGGDKPYVDTDFIAWFEGGNGSNSSKKLNVIINNSSGYRHNTTTGFYSISTQSRTPTDSPETLSQSSETIGEIEIWANNESRDFVLHNVWANHVIAHGTMTPGYNYCPVYFNSSSVNIAEFPDVESLTSFSYSSFSANEIYFNNATRSPGTSNVFIPASSCYGVNMIQIGHAGGTLPHSNFSSLCFADKVKTVKVPVANITEWISAYSSNFAGRIVPIEPQPAVDFAGKASNKTEGFSFPIEIKYNIYPIDQYGAPATITGEITVSSSTATVTKIDDSNWKISYPSSGNYTITYSMGSLTKTVTTTVGTPSDWSVEFQTTGVIPKFYAMSAEPAPQGTLGNAIVSTNYKVGNSWSSCKITINTAGTYKISFGQSCEGKSYDYIRAGTIPSSWVYWYEGDPSSYTAINGKRNGGSTMVSITMSGHSVQDAEAYWIMENLTAGYTFLVGYRKDGSGDSGLDKGWFWLEKIS